MHDKKEVTSLQWELQSVMHDTTLYSCKMLQYYIMCLEHVVMNYCTCWLFDLLLLYLLTVWPVVYYTCWQLAMGLYKTTFSFFSVLICCPAVSWQSQYKQHSWCNKTETYFCNTPYSTNQIAQIIEHRVDIAVHWQSKSSCCLVCGLQMLLAIILLSSLLPC